MFVPNGDYYPLVSYHIDVIDQWGTVTPCGSYTLKDARSIVKCFKESSGNIKTSVRPYVRWKINPDKYY